MNLFKNVHETWIPLLHSLAYEKPMVEFLESLSDMNYQPGFEQIFSVFEMPVDKIKIVILGLEPYPLPMMANGTAYGVLKNVKMTETLKIIKEEIYKTTGIGRLMKQEDPNWKTLGHLSAQGVFLLNASLTVETGYFGSHRENWKAFTNRVISFISVSRPCIWMLWGYYLNGCRKYISNPIIVGNYDRETIEYIPADRELNYIIPGELPNPLVVENEETFSNDGFYMANAILQKNNISKIAW